jgi:hypothetical protein
MEPSRETSSLRKQRSVAVVGISPAQVCDYCKGFKHAFTHSPDLSQHLLLVHTPTRESPSIPREWEAVYEDGDRDISSSPSSHGRNRTLHGFGNDSAWSGTGSPKSRIRTTSTPDRLRTPQIFGSPTSGNVAGS